MQVFDTITNSVQILSEESINTFLYDIMAFDGPDNAPPLDLLLEDNDEITFPNTARTCKQIRLLTPLTQELEMRCLELAGVKRLILEKRLTDDQALLILRAERRSWLRQ